jgi:hypothetical protein
LQPLDAQRMEFDPRIQNSTYDVDFYGIGNI